MKRSILLFLTLLFTLTATQRGLSQTVMSESFDGSTFPPSGWSVSGCSGTSDGGGCSCNTWIRLASGGGVVPAPLPSHSGSGMAWYNSWDIYSGGVCRMYTPAANLSAYSSGSNQVSFYYYYSSNSAGDYTTIYVNTSASTTGATTLGTVSILGGTANTWGQITYTIPSSYYSSSTVYIIFEGHSNYGNDQAIDDISINHIGPCTGTPTVTTSMPSTSLSVCSGATTILSADGGVSSGQVYQWQTSTSSSGPWTNVTGATNTSYTTPAITSCVYFREKDSCTASGGVGYSPVFSVCAGSPTYATVPYFQDFESWTNFCATHDVPSNNWKTSPAYTDSSWRRDDEGWSYGGWSTYGTGYYAPGYWTPYPTPYQHGSHSARFHSSPGYGYSYYGTNYRGNMDLYLDCSGSTGNKLLNFWLLNQGSSSTPSDLFNGNDSLLIWLSTDGGVTFNKLYSCDSAQRWEQNKVQVPSNSAQTVVRLQGWRTFRNKMGYGYDYDQSDIAVDSLYVGPPCNSTPSTPVVTPGGTLSACAAAQYTLVAGGTPLVGGLKYTWQQSTNGGTTWTNTGDTNYTMSTPTLWNNIQYRVTVTCPYIGSPNSATSSATTINISNAPSYAPSLPYSESFERFQNRCATADAFSPYTATYTNNSNPYTGYVSWRRVDKGSTASWYSGGSTGSPYCYSPLAIDSTYSAHVETYYTYGGNNQADMYHFVNCSSPIGVKELDFNYNMSMNYSPADSLIVAYSVDSGATFSRLGVYNSNSSGWSIVQRYSLPSNSPKTVLKFTVRHPNYYQYSSGVGLDAVLIIPPCTGKPTAGAIPAMTQCANKPFYISVTGYSRAAGLHFQWQMSPDNIVWVNTSAGDTGATAKITLSAAGYLRVIVTCTNSGLSDTTAPKYINMKPFYYCYCDPDTLTSGSQYDYIYFGFNNFAITKVSTGDTVLNNGNPLPVYSNSRIYAMYYAGAVYRTPHAGYTNWDTLSRLPQRMYLDSTYWFYFTIGSYSSYIYSYPINAYIDYDHNAKFDATEKVFDKNNSTGTTLATLPHAKDSVHIPNTALVGKTGLRILYGYAYSTPLDPCGPPSYHYGEVQDYLVDIQYRPCNGPVNAGTAQTTDTAMCIGYNFRITDTTHEYKQSGISWWWQSSTNNITWGNMTGTTGRDTMTLAFSGTRYYRMAITCGNSHDTTYSASVKVALAPPYKCYCYSMSIGGTYYDSSDIGAFTIGKYVINKKGPHVLNPIATGSHTNYTGSTIHLAIDSTYAVGVYHILKSRTHGDAKVTMFIDYNNNFQYDIPEERVWTGYTTSSDWYITTSITVPHSVIGGVPTGMRLIINNNTSPNVPSDSACGVYISGETQDYVVQFDNVWPAGIGTITGIQNLDMYPNPTEGKFNVTFTADKAISKLQINVTNMTGQQVLQRTYNNTNGQFSEELDMTNQPRGLYFVEFTADGERMIRKLVVR